MDKNLLVAASDLHTEFYNRFEHLDPLADLFEPANFLVLAGDLASHYDTSKLLYFIKKVIKKYNHIIMISGNHDYWNPRIFNQRSCLEEVANQFKNVHLLNRDVITLDNMRFAGCMAWYELDPICAMNDLRQIHDAVNWSRREHRLDKAFLRSLKPNSIDVLITHVPLIEQGMNPVLAANQPYMNKYYHHGLESLVTGLRPILAISGHTHHPLNLKIDGTQFVSAPVGYPDEIAYDYKPYVLQ